MALSTSAKYAVLCAGLHAVATDVTPLQKVVAMMDEMLAKCKEDKHQEETEFATFQAWCDGTVKETTISIQDGAESIEQLIADIAKAQADAEAAAADAEDNLARADADQAELDRLTAIREKEHADYSATHADLSESLDALARALATLKAKEADVPQALMQVKRVARLSGVIDSLMQQAPEANAYEFQGGTVVKMLEDLTHKFEDERLALEKVEMNAKAEFDVLHQKLFASVKEAKATAGRKTVLKAKRLDDAATGKGDLTITKKTKAEDEKTLADTKAECQSRADVFEKDQEVRAGEIEAINMAKKILTSDEVSGAADKHLPAALVQNAALAQLRGEDQSPARRKAMELLQGRAKELGSRYLALAAARVAADPFVKVKKMIKDLIVKLMEEANAEADHNAYCTTELATNKQTREIKTTETEELSAEIEKRTAESAQLKEHISILTNAVAELKAKQSEATELRNEEKATNTKTIEEAKVAQVAVEKATAVLKDFYAQASGGASLLQGQGPRNDMAERLGLKDQMDRVNTASASYSGGNAGGIMSMLEVILSDFARLETETTSAEAQGQAKYQTFMDESAEDIAVKDTETNHKANRRDQCESELRSLKKELGLTQEELNAAMDYYSKLKDDCLETGLSYEERVAKREEEIQALKEALQVLAQESV